MRTAWIVAGGLLVIAGGLAWKRSGQPPESAEAQPSAHSANASGPGAGASPAPATQKRHPAAAPGSERKPDYESELRNSADRWDLAQALFAEAKHGNAAAQFYLSMILSDCKAFDDMYVKTGNRRRTFDEAVQYAATRGGLNWEYVAPIFTSCRRLMEREETPFGTWEDWLQEATANGYPKALVMTASFEAINGVYSTDPQEKELQIGDARRLAMQALRTKDPAVVAEMGSVTSWLRKFEGLDPEPEWVWLLAACQQGLDCSRESSRYRLRCAVDSGCQPYEAGMVDVIRRDSGASFADLEQCANEINEKLDADRFDEFGL